MMEFMDFLFKYFERCANLLNNSTCLLSMDNKYKLGGFWDLYLDCYVLCLALINYYMRNCDLYYRYYDED